MSTSLVIVAIPEEQDRVWKVSSEQVPHLTLLYLGDVDQVQNLDQIMQFVDHAVTLSEHGPFYLDVDRRGTLGDAEADVLFFNKRSWNLKWIRQFRGQLLQNQAIRTAFDSTAQILEASQEWLPHLTLGYPDTPAKPLPEEGFDHPFYSVCFDRIAVWAEDFNGPEFQLEWPDREMDGDLAIAYSDTKKAELLHVRHGGIATEAEPTEDSTTQIAERGKEFIEHKSVLDNPTLAEQIKAKIRSILDDVTGDADNDISLFGDPLIRTKIQSVLEDFYKDPNVDNVVVYDALGAAFLEHWGVKGMRWGFRRSGTTPTPISSKSTHTLLKGKAKVEVEGGKHHPAHEDAVKVAEARQKLKKSGAAALSNKDLQDVATRLNLENQVATLVSSKGKKFVSKQFEVESQNLAREGIRSGVKEGLKRAKTAA